jgi:beta-lactam-binding protein with PASTA domain
VLLTDEVLAPDVVGLNQAAAEAAILGARLTVGAVTTDYSDTVPAGSVIGQTPLAGTIVLAGSAVDIVVALGPAPVIVPDVVGLNQAAAELPSCCHLAVGTITSANSDTVPAGSVIEQNPTAGSSVLTGSAVDLVVSLGPEPVIVPDVVGLSQAAAEAAILGADLTVGLMSLANSDTVPAGSVIEQNPIAGSSVAPGTAVDLVISCRTSR